MKFGIDVAVVARAIVARWWPGRCMIIGAGSLVGAALAFAMGLHLTEWAFFCLGMVVALAAFDLLAARPAKPDAVATLPSEESILLEQCFAILRKQVTATIGTSERAVLAVVEHLNRVHAVSSELQQHVAVAVGRSHDLSQHSLDDAGRNGEAVRALAETRERVIQARITNQARIRAVVQQVRQLEPLAAAISSISRQTSLLAVNAAIEAAHAGPEGAGFKVVATEVKRLSALTNDAARKITEGVNAVASAIEHEMAAGASIDADAGADKLAGVAATVDQMSKRLGEVLPYLAQLHARMEGGMQRVDEDIVTSLAQMQFQDLNRQMLEQVDTALGSLSGLSTTLSSPSVQAGQAPSQRLRELLDGWNRDYVMTEQRLAHHSSLGMSAPIQY